MALPDAPAVNRNYVLLLALVAALGGLLFGYDTAVVSGAIGPLQVHFKLDDAAKGFAASSALIGCIFGAAFAGTVSDRFGRRKAMLLAAVLFTVSAVGSALPKTMLVFNVYRIVGGLGVGIASMLSPMYIAEVAPARGRGRLVSLNQFAIILGMLVVYFVNAWIASLGDATWNVETGWRWMFGSETLPAVLFFILLFAVPESPRWLLKQGRAAEAEAILGRIGGAPYARAECESVQAALAVEGGSWRDLLSPAMRLPLAIGIVLAVLQQVTGINVVLYYAPEIFKSAGQATQQALNDTVMVGAVNLAFTLVAIWVVDRAGRKPLLLVASLVMGLSLLALGISYHPGQAAGRLVLVLVLVYVAGFAVAMGPVVWVVISEIFPTAVRGRAVSVATVCLWIACYTVSQTYPMLEKRIGGTVFFIYAAMCLVSLVFVALFVPETKGQSLEEIERRWLGRAPRRPESRGPA